MEEKAALIANKRIPIRDLISYNEKHDEILLSQIKKLDNNKNNPN